MPTYTTIQMFGVNIQKFGINVLSNVKPVWLRIEVKNVLMC